MKRLLRHGLWICYLIFFQTFIFSIVIFQVRSPLPTDLDYDVTALRAPSEYDNFAYLLEDSQVALHMRLALIHKAETTIALTTYAIHDGQARDVLYGALLSAADRGVRVKLVIDGFVEGRLISDFQTTSHFMTHPNIEVRFFEPFALYRPHAVQNRLHDKLIIIDQQYGIIGGRNIGDRYFMVSDQTEAMTYDRDVLIFGYPTSQSVLDMQTYFDELFEHPYTARENEQETTSVSVATKHMLREAYEHYVIDETLELEKKITYLHDHAVKTDAITFLRSPLNRMHKQPVIFNTLKQLAISYDTFLIQTPYFIADRLMREHFAAFEDVDVTVLTNSPMTNPNLLAVAGYAPIRDQLAAKTTLYEYHAHSSIHAKTLLMGDDITVIGSYNIDPRSVSLSTESVVVIHSETFQEATRVALEPLIHTSLHITSEGTHNLHDLSIIEETRTRRFVRSMLEFLLRPFDYML